MKIKEFMTRDVEIVAPDVPVRDAARLMRELDTGFLPVAENERLIGTLTDRDIALRSTAEGQDPKVALVRESMTADLVYCHEEDDSSEVARLMGERQVRRLPVLNQDKRLVGVVSLGDIAKAGEQEGVAGKALEDIVQVGGQHRQ